MTPTSSTFATRVGARRVHDTHTSSRRTHRRRGVPSVVSTRATTTTTNQHDNDNDVSVDYDDRRLATLRAILRLDDHGLAQLSTSVEGRTVVRDVPVRALASRVRSLKDALPEACSRHVFELVVERPGLLLTADDDGSDARAVVSACADALGGVDVFVRLCDECAPAFAHLLTRLGRDGVEYREMERCLREWADGSEGWHRVFVQRVASEWGYLRMMRRMDTKTLAGNGVVYVNQRTGESIRFRQSRSMDERAKDSQYRGMC